MVTGQLQQGSDGFKTPPWSNAGAVQLMNSLHGGCNCLLNWDTKHVRAGKADFALWWMPADHLAFNFNSKCSSRQ